jgi:hypothetical protein
MIRLRVGLLVAGMSVLAAAPAWATAITLGFSGPSSNGPLDGTAVLTGNAGGSTLALTLTNDITNQQSIGQSISGFSFEVADAAGHLVTITPTITSQSGREVTFSGGNDTATDIGSNGAGADPSGWGLSSSNPAYLNGLGFTGPDGTNPPDELILGPSTSGLTWADANGSIDNSHSHQPQVDQTLNLTLSLGTTLPTGFSIVNAIMYFGTGPDAQLSPGVTTTANTPEPASLALFGTGLGLLAVKLRKRKTAA